MFCLPYDVSKAEIFFQFLYDELMHCISCSYLLPLRQSKTKRKTPVIRRTREAFWDYQTEYDVDFDELPELGIEFLVGSNFC